jgi:hypothetical protein
MTTRKKKASDTDAEVSEVTKKKHVTMTDDKKPRSRSTTPKLTATGTVTDIRNRYCKDFFSYLILPPPPPPPLSIFILLSHTPTTHEIKILSCTVASLES